MNPERMIADLAAGAGDLARRSAELRDRIRRASVTHRSPDGVVTATVAANGALQHIEFSPDAAGLSPALLGEVVMATVRRAQAQAARQVVSIVEPQFGRTPAMEFLTRAVPAGEPVTSATPEPPLPRSLWEPPAEPGAGTAAR